MPSTICGAPTLNGSPCRIHTSATYPCCWIHSRSALRSKTRCAGARIRTPGPPKVSLRVKPSRIAGAGRGLFVDSARTTARTARTAVFRAGEKIARYTGKLLTKKQLDKLYPGKDELAPYAVAAGRVDGKQMYIDGASWKSSVARYANDGCGPKGYAKGYAVSGVSTHCKRTNAYLKGGKGKVWLVALKNLYDGDEIYTEYGPEYWRGAKPAERAKPAEFSKKLAVRRGYANELEVLLSVHGKKHLQQVVKRKSGAGRIVTKDAGVAATLVPRATLFKERKVIEKHLRSALRALHKAGWRHHDLYPRNVTRTVDPRGGKPVYTLIDYDKMKRATKSSHVTEDVQTLLSRMKI